MSTALLSFFSPEYQPLHDVVAPVKNRYCARHGYEHIVRDRPWRANPGYYAYDRLAYINDLFADGMDVILCANVHTQIMTHSVTIESFLEDGKDLYITVDPNGLNAGVFILRKSEWTRRWLEMLLSIEERYANHPGHEQQAMNDSLQWDDYWQDNTWSEGVKQVDQVLLNSYLYRHYNHLNRTPPVPGEFEKGKSLLVHLPGRSVFHPEPTPLVQTRCAIFSSPEITDNIVY